MKKENIRLDLILLKEGTQQRPLDEDTLSRYENLMADGLEFPPIEVVSDGVNFWLWDGFHRVECAKRRGDKTIAGYVTEGTLRDAIWLSFGANKAHGLPRQKGIARKIIETILTDSSWSKTSLSAIARHVGVTRQYVGEIKEDLSAHGASTCTIDENGDSESKTAVQDEQRPTVQRDDEIEVKRGGTTYKQKSQERPRRRRGGPYSRIRKEVLARLSAHDDDGDSGPPKACLEPGERDSVGRVIPEHLRRVYQDRVVIQGFVNQLTDLKKDIIGQIDILHDPVFTLLNITAFQANFENLRRTLKSAMPYAVCCYCGGEDSKNCKACQGFGLLNRDSYEAAPKELRT